YPSDAGCPENPITAARVELSPPASSPADDLVLRASSPNAAEFAKVLKDLRDHPNDNCMRLKAGALVACTGTFNSVITSFVMATDASMVEESGAPVHARCVTVPELACGIDDDIADGVTFQAALPKGTMHDISPDKLQEIYKAIYATVAHLRARN
ncbi:MAG TPA: hypothetical protein VJS85_00300, partial [Rhizomicrobium sp.]|nr:hypothetical protein [Rhizomicrobium sp.]